LKKYAVIETVRVVLGVKNMYSMLPGCYSFKDELKIFLLWFKEQTDALILKIYELERMLNC
jgi:hypothetical protein